MLNLISDYKLDGNLSDTWGTNGGTFNGGTPDYRPEKECISGQCLNFDGVNDYISLPANANTGLQNSINTVAMWANIRSVGPNAYGEPYSVTGGNRTGIKWNAGRIGVDANGDFYNYYVPVSLTYNSWNYIVVEIDRTINKAKVYINGVYKGQTAAWTTYTPTGNTVLIGGNVLTNNAGDYLNGMLDDIRLYNQSVPTSLIEENYYAKLNRLRYNNVISPDEYKERLISLSNKNN